MTKAANHPLVRAENIRKEFQSGDERLAVLGGVDLALDAGRSVAVMGPSGSGKSTLLQILGTLDTPSEGRVELAGCDPFALPEAELAQFRNREIGFVFQDHQLLPQCTALENVLVPTLAAAPLASAADPAERARELLGRLGLAERLGHRPADMSGGEQQRVAIARALINSPSILLCDEPTGNLDEATGAEIGRCFRQFQEEEGVALIVVTHNAAFAEVFDGTLRLRKGQLVET